jgi:hypothetical protein
MTSRSFCARNVPRLRSLAGSRAAPSQCGAYAGTGLPAGQRRLSAGAAGFSQLPPLVYGRGRAAGDAESLNRA